MDIFSLLKHILLFLSSLLSYPFTKNKPKKEPKQRPNLPPGSMGWPYIGETLQLYSQDPNLFFSSKQKRYGDIFKTHILGHPCVMLACPEDAKFVLVTHSHLFKPTYPKSKEKLIGPFALFFHQGQYHTHLRKLVQTSLSLDSFRTLIPNIEAEAISALESWACCGQVVNTFDEMKKFAFDVGVLAIFGQLDRNYRGKLKEKYQIVDKGYNSFPSSIPGTAYHKALLARRRLGEMLSEIISEKKEKKLLLGKDLLSHFLNSNGGKGETFSEDQIVDNIIGVLFAAQDTTASVLTWILKYLHDEQKLFEAVKEEQMAIYESNDGGKKCLTWAQTRKMTLTNRVILESLRMASVISFTFREAVTDIEYKGYLIPKGWKVMPLFRNIHHNPEFFTDPQTFDPSRFEVSPKPNTFMPFGNGVHACPGNELAKLEILIFIHHLVTKFRWEVVGSKDGIQYAPFPVPQQGLPARFWKELTLQEVTNKIY
ncbi:Abscisic acid 8'-hydroxylase 4 isoform 1 [Tripterygium wilfordii]|uniref:(+)-abscisic acid 8'-hydroxylase n=1 Tax=Tripterygium wilfordii TaxID=458696 RepID=A0A7J7DXU3_TRIWF|nr:abscisic acid 8'-hydroxylase 4-like [Tripterygium wilfordii]KAF5751210.1 Abscisic acid 8'-hydroxylase 4 isoform 1 [Tripterygium wilfordii]